MASTPGTGGTGVDEGGAEDEESEEEGVPAQ